MKSVDTNIVVRLIAADDEGQLASALYLLATSDVFISLGVLIESEWVLRSYYLYDRQRLNNALVALLDLSGVLVVDREAVDWALSRHALGADLADMLHLVGSKNAESFVTFDKYLTRDAGDASPVRVELIKASAAPLADS